MERGYRKDLMVKSIKQIPYLEIWEEEGKKYIDVCLGKTEEEASEIIRKIKAYKDSVA